MLTAMAKTKTRSPAYGCSACGATSARWAGRCGACGAMNSLVELTAGEAQLVAAGAQQQRAAGALAVEALDAEDSGGDVPRIPTGLVECDRVLGGGLPAGAAIVIGGEPGIGKSTLLAQIGGAVGAQHAVLYVTAEESTGQVRARCKRLGAEGPRLKLTASGDADAIAGAIRSGDYRLVIVDSIQLTAKHQAATPVNWKGGEEVIIVPAVSDDAAKEKFPEGWRAEKPYLRYVKQPQ